MSKKTAVLERRHKKGVKLSDALAEDAPLFKAQKGQISKTATLIKAVDDPEIKEALATGENMRPSSDQLAKINQFTRSPKTADEVVAFPTLSCNDLVDRDDDQFSTQCVKDFAALEQPFSPTGKSFMLDHEYKTKNQVGRIFDTETKKIGGVQWLKNEVYVPNTDENKSLIEGIDFGVHWAVSVGVVLGRSVCTVCNERFMSYGWWCVNGHDKGYYYDPNSDETDSWGYPAPCDPNDKNAVKCVRVFEDPKDMYELSQVFLGAQYFAALDKDPAFKGIIKAASADLPIIGLKEEEARKLPLTHEPSEVSEARRTFSVKETDDGELMWTDNHGVRWVFDPENPEDGVCSIGKASSDDNNSEEDSEEEEDNDGEREEQSDEGDEHSSDDEGSESESDASAGDGGQGQGGNQASAPEQQQGGESGTQGSLTDDDEKALTGDALLAAARKANVSETTLAKLAAAKTITVGTLVALQAKEISELSETNKSLTPKAELGDQYIEELRSDAIHWYVVSRQSKEGEKVKTESVQKIIDACGDNVELLKAHIEDYKEVAKQRFPKRARSSFPSDVNDGDRPKGADGPDRNDSGDDRPEFMRIATRNDEAQKVRNIHG